MNDLNISIGNVGDYGLLERCLRSIYAEDDPGFRFTVYVVYNAPAGTETYRFIERDFPQVRLIRRVGPIGVSAAHNIVLGQGDSRYVLALDDDTVVPKSTLPRVVEFMDRHPDVGIAGCKTLNTDGTFQKSFGLAPGLRSELVNAFRPDSFWPDSLYEDVSSVREVHWLIGAFMMVRREALQVVGGLDEFYDTSVFESDWCFRMHRAGFKVIYIPDVHIIHHGGVHSINYKLKVTNRKQLVRYHVNRFYFFRKHYGTFRMHLLRPIMFAGSVARAAFYSGMYLLKPELRNVALVRIKTFTDVARLSLSRRPYSLPERLEQRPHREF